MLNVFFVIYRQIYAARVRVDAVSKVADLETAEKEKMKAKVEKILKHNINVFINRLAFGHSVSIEPSFLLTLFYRLQKDERKLVEFGSFVFFCNLKLC